MDSPPLTSGGPVEAASLRSCSSSAAISPPLTSGGPVEAKEIRETIEAEVSSPPLTSGGPVEADSACAVSWQNEPLSAAHERRPR